MKMKISAARLGPYGSGQTLFTFYKLLATKQYTSPYTCPEDSVCKWL